MFKKPKDEKINEYMRKALEVVANFMEKNKIDKKKIKIYMDSEALCDL
jgi:hypothetical protein